MRVPVLIFQLIYGSSWSTMHIYSRIRGSKVRWYLLGFLALLGFLLTANTFPTLDGRRSINHLKNERDDAIKEAVDAVFKVRISWGKSCNNI